MDKRYKVIVVSRMPTGQVMHEIEVARGGTHLYDLLLLITGHREKGFKTPQPIENIADYDFIILGPDIQVTEVPPQLSLPILTYEAMAYTEMAVLRLLIEDTIQKFTPLRKAPVPVDYLPKRYLLFGYQRHYPSGGMRDYLAGFDSQLEARVWVEKGYYKTNRQSIEWPDHFHVLDKDTLHIVWQSHPESGTSNAQLITLQDFTR